MEKVSLDVAVGAGIDSQQGLAESLTAPYATYNVECVGNDGLVKWVETFRNTVMTAGKTDIIDKYFKGSTYTAAFYVGLISSTGYSAIAAGDTAASHAGWTEDQSYSQGTRPALTLGTVSSGSVDNSASKAQYSINGTATIKGAFVITNSTKGGTTGTLYSAGLFSGGDRSVVNGDTLNVTVTVSAS